MMTHFRLPHFFTMMKGAACERCDVDPCECSDPDRVEASSDSEPSIVEAIERFLPDSDFQCHQPESPIELDPYVPTEAEKDVAKPPKRTAIMAVGGKAPKPSKRERSPPRRAVRLDRFFDEYDTPDAQRVVLCRSYASFVASTLPKKQKK